MIVTVTESSDNCATPLIVPAAGPFPWSVTLNSEWHRGRPGSIPTAVGAAIRSSRSARCGSRSRRRRAATTRSRSAPPRARDSSPRTTARRAVRTTALPMCVANTLAQRQLRHRSMRSLELTAGVDYRFVVSSYYSNGFGPITVYDRSRHRRRRGHPLRITGHGPLAGGAKVVVTGAGFADGAIVRFGGVAATGVTVISPNLLTAIVPRTRQATSTSRCRPRTTRDVIERVHLRAPPPRRVRRYPSSSEGTCRRSERISAGRSVVARDRGTCLTRRFVLLTDPSARPPVPRLAAGSTASNTRMKFPPSTFSTSFASCRARAGAR